MKIHENIKIIGAGKGWIVVDKPCQVSVHNEPGRDLVSLVSSMVGNDPVLCKETGYSKSSGISPVHRLDRETSGVMILSAHRETAAWFSAQFEERRVKKTYVALVHGQFDMGAGDECLWNRDLSQDAGGRERPEGSGNKVACATRVKLLDLSPHYSLIECELLTGRQHQIRRHAKLAGHPVLGDQRYGSKRALNYLKTQCSFERLALHSHHLSIVLPGNEEEKSFISPCPECFLELMEKDRG